MTDAVAGKGTLKVAALQLNSQTDVGRNLERCRQLVEGAAQAGAKLVVLPENFAYLGPERGRVALAERFGDHSAPIQRALGRMARQNSVFLVGGGFPEVGGDPDRPFNCCALFSPEGELLVRYRKLHLFDVDLPDGTTLRESASTTAGAELVVHPVAGFNLGLSICYDLRFPELYRGLVDLGADALLVPAAFTLQTGRDHWHVLTRARAIESQSWVIAANQWGRHGPGRASYGHSLIADPWGTVVAECSDKVGFALAEIDRGQVEGVRRALPCLSHRRLRTCGPA